MNCDLLSLFPKVFQSSNLVVPRELPARIQESSYEDSALPSWSQAISVQKKSALVCFWLISPLVMSRRKGAGRDTRGRGGGPIDTEHNDGRAGKRRAERARPEDKGAPGELQHSVPDLLPIYCCQRHRRRRRRRRRRGQREKFPPTAPGNKVDTRRGRGELQGLQRSRGGRQGGEPMGGLDRRRACPSAAGLQMGRRAGGSVGTEAVGREPLTAAHTPTHKHKAHSECMRLLAAASRAPTHAYCPLPH